MNKYPIWWDKSITVYNKFTDATTQEVTWYRLVIPSCFFVTVREKTNTGTSIIETQSTIARIPKSDKFLEQYLWKALPPTSKSLYFTLGGDDILIKGTVTDVINDYVAGSRATDIIKKYRSQGCIVIDYFINNSESIRNEQHYYVRGK